MSSDQSPSQDEQIPIGPGGEPRWLLLRTVATSRPMREVVALVHLLNQAGEYPRPGDQALRLAAVTRSINEVHQLIALLREPPGTAEDAGTVLQAAAAERPIEDVAELITSFAPGEGEAWAPDASPASGPERTAREASVAPEAFAGPDAIERPVPDVAVAAPQEAAPPVLADMAKAPTERKAAVPPVPDAAPAPVRVPRAPGTAPAEQATAKRSPSVPVRSVLRWPAAVALLVIGAIHLPTGLRDLRAGDLAAGASLGIAVVCLTLACLLPLYDPLWAWMAGAAAALGIVAVHSLARGLNSVHLLRDSLGSTFSGATRLMVLCAVIAAALAATVLTRKSKAGTANET
ncbi:hypothetical protein ABR738_06410 [Streptomyces sp. Edi4]|uniref:hypothetical protein n=1 Tax=Streptomyces sp. Edi4 TaxID=3162527 RepID=UPI0033057325